MKISNILTYIICTIISLIVITMALNGILERGAEAADTISGTNSAGNHYSSTAPANAEIIPTYY